MNGQQSVSAVTKKGPAPTVYTEDLVAEILSQLEEGKGLRTICREMGLCRRTVRRWDVDDVDGFHARYVRARDAGLDEVAEDIIEISDDGSRDYTVDEEGREIVDHDHIARAKLRVDSRKWYLSKIAPKRYGDRTEHVVDVTHRYVVVGETEALTDETWIEGAVER